MFLIYFQVNFVFVKQQPFAYINQSLSLMSTTIFRLQQLITFHLYQTTTFRSYQTPTFHLCQTTTFRSHYYNSHVSYNQFVNYCVMSLSIASTNHFTLFFNILFIFSQPLPTTNRFVPVFKHFCHSLRFFFYNQVLQQFNNHLHQPFFSSLFPANHFHFSSSNCFFLPYFTLPANFRIRLFVFFCPFTAKSSGGAM